MSTSWRAWCWTTIAGGADRVVLLAVFAGLWLLLPRRERSRHQGPRRDNRAMRAGLAVSRSSSPGRRRAAERPAARRQARPAGPELQRDGGARDARTDEGAVGVILNRPTRARLADVAPRLRAPGFPAAALRRRPGIAPGGGGAVSRRCAARAAAFHVLGDVYSASIRRTSRRCSLEPGAACGFMPGFPAGRPSSSSRSRLGQLVCAARERRIVVSPGHVEAVGELVASARARARADMTQGIRYTGP